MSEVKLKVRRNALALQEFTAVDVIRATGLNPESVRTELQRMKQDGLIVATGRAAGEARRGAHPLRYRLAPDAEARRAIADSIESFYPTRPTEERPTSRYFQATVRQLDQAFVASDSERRQLLAEAAHNLATAEDAAGGRFASDLVRAHLRLESGRLAYLAGDDEAARARLEAARPAFVRARDDGTLRRIDEFLLCIKLRGAVTAGHPATAGEGDAAHSLVDVLAAAGYRPDSPLLALLLEHRHLRWTASQLRRLVDALVPASQPRAVPPQRQRAGTTGWEGIDGPLTSEAGRTFGAGGT